MKRTLRLLIPFVVLALLLTSCAVPVAPNAPAVVTQIVEKEKVVEVEKVITATPAAASETAVPAAPQGNESPVLAEQVAAGKLPPLEERLPDSPFIVGPGVLASKEALPDWQPGIYGGTMRFAHNGAFSPDPFVMITDNWVETGDELHMADWKPNIAEKIDVSPDYTTYTFVIRRGLKWSDGEPVTTEDVRFAWEDVQLNEDITPGGPPSIFRTPGASDPMQLSIVDDYTFTITFSKPYPSFPLYIAHAGGWPTYMNSLKPKHFLQQFHADYADPAALKAELTKAKLADDAWAELFRLKDAANWDIGTGTKTIGLPVLLPWMMVSNENGVITWERNPYYWKVDVEGRQLPYIDRLVSVSVGSVEMLNMRGIAGDLDFIREGPDLQKVPLYKEHEAQNNTKVWISAPTSNNALYLNYNIDDPILKPVFSDIRFREALYYAINQETIIEDLYLGFAEQPLMVAPLTYDPAKAEATLDEMGMTKGADGMRTAPDGQPFQFVIEAAPLTADVIPSAELVVADLQAVGLNVSLKQVDNALLNQRGANNEVQAEFGWEHISQWVANPSYLPCNGGMCMLAPLWAQWHNTDGKEGVEPPDGIKRLYEIAAKRNTVAPDSPEDQALYNELLQNFAENHWVIHMPYASTPLITNAKLRNIALEGGTYRGVDANISGEQYYFEP